MKKTPKAKKPSKRFSVMLLYPEYIAYEGPETFYAFVRAADRDGAIRNARRQAVKHNDIYFDEESRAAGNKPEDFEPELVVRGWQRGV